VEDPTDRYCATNTIKVQGKLFVGKGTVLYSDLGKALFTVVEDTCGRHDTIYGCCSEPNNFLRYGIRGTHSCFGNFVEALAQFGLDRSYIVSNVNFFMSVPVAIDGAVVNIYGHSAAGNYVDLRAERDVLAVLSNCPQMHNLCNAYNLTPIRAIIWRPSRSGKP
jgi:urea carboxylase-associated protein 1